MFTGWFGFWIFLTTYLLIDWQIFKTGANGLFYTYKTPIELELQKTIVAERGKK